MKTKIRRLYDIANILVSLGMIVKTSLDDSKKPAFRWAATALHQPPTQQARSSSTPQLRTPGAYSQCVSPPPPSLHSCGRLHRFAVPRPLLV